MVKEHLLYRRQFLLARQPLSERYEWQIMEIGHYYLHVHPDLGTTMVNDNTRKLILLGYLFDPDHYQANNQDILEEILFNTKDFGTMVIELKKYVGRYALIYYDGECINIVQDALALREVYYSQKENLVVCGSQPNLLVRFSQPKIRESTDPILLDFRQNHLPHVRNGRLWPGDGTPYEEIKHLLPNHCLDINRLTCFRYWPNRPVQKMDIDEAVSKCASFLQGALRAVAYRHPVMLAVTAGLDSRTLLAASKDIANSIYFFINKEEYRLSDKSADIWVPKEIFKRIGLPFNIHQISTDEVPSDFKNIFLENTLSAKVMLLPVIYNIYFKQHQDKVNILGVGEIGRTKFFDPPKHLSAYYLSYMLKYRKSNYAVRECERWLANSKHIAEQYGLNIMTLFWWEILIGNWGSVGNSESDIAIEEFDPYASHFLYETFLSVDAKYRTFRDNILFEKLVGFMWPELLEVPVNPPDHFRDYLITALHKIGVERYFRSLKYSFYKLLYHSIGESEK